MRRYAKLVAIIAVAVFATPILAQTPTTAPSTSDGSAILPQMPPTPGITGEWFGARKTLSDDGFTVAAAIYYDYSKNFSGGLDTAGDANREYFDLNIAWTTDQLLNWKGGLFFFNFLDHEGDNGSTKLTGDAQMFDYQDGPTGAQIYQLFFQQTLPGDQFRIKIGRMDTGLDFAYTDNGAAFLNTSFGNSPAIVGLPSYPDPAPGAAIFWTPPGPFYVDADVSDANKSDRFGILTGNPELAQPATSGEFLIAEFGAKWKATPGDLPGRAAIGAYYDTGTFHRFDGSSQSGAAGMYANLDQTIWQQSPAAAGASNPNVGVFEMFGIADGRVSPFDQFAAAGVQWTGPIHSQARASDVVGLGATYVHFSPRGPFTEEFELAIEGFYKWQITPWFNLQPDLQYIINPGGRGLANACVATLRVELDF